MRFFNTEGPVRAEDHYCIPPLERLDLEQVLSFVRQKRYFVLHAPRQTGKTSALLALRDLLNGGQAGDYRCLYANFEVAQAAREDLKRAMRAILVQMGGRARRSLGDEALAEIWPRALAEAGPDAALTETLARFCEDDPRPLVLLIDEIDSLIGDTLLSVLRQLRAGYDERPRGFPHSIVLCGVRDVRDYRIHSSAEGALVLGGSAFNVKAQSLRLGDFTTEETRTLLGQHTEATGQAFEPLARDLIHRQTAGQPWLVNALCREACFDSEAGRDRSRPIAAPAVLQAQERLIAARETHLDNLADKLRDERVRRIVTPMLAGDVSRRSYAERDRDLEYARDLGLVAQGGPPRIANPIYAEVIPRELTFVTQEDIGDQTAWFVDADGGLDVPGLMAAFQEFFRQHAKHWVQRFDRYHEAGPQLLLQAFLQRIVNGGGRLEREYALGRGRVDLLILWPRGGVETRSVVECKVRRGNLERSIAEGIEQTRGYMDRCGAESGHLVVFDRSPDRAWEEKLFRREPSGDGAPVTVWGM